MNKKYLASILLVLLSSTPVLSQDIKDINTYQYKIAYDEDIPTEYNPNAPEDYKGDFKEGDLVVAVGTSKDLKIMRVAKKVDDMYLLFPNEVSFYYAKQNKEVKLYKSNSVYKFYDIKEFNKVSSKYKNIVKAHLKTYANKFGKEIESLTGSSDNQDYYYSNVKDYHKDLKSLEDIKKDLLKFESLPNTYLEYEKNPYIWSEIANNSKEYTETLLNNPNKQFQKSLEDSISEINKITESIINFNGKGSLYSSSKSIDWVWRSISEKRRKDFFAQNLAFKEQIDLFKIIQKDLNEPFKPLNDALNNLKEAFDSKIVNYKIDSNYFKYKDAESEKVMKSYLKDISKINIFNIGMETSDWIIVKSSSGTPLHKYKKGTMLVKTSNDDFDYCKALFFVVQQEHSGKGKYTKSKISQYHEEIYGCP